MWFHAGLGRESILEDDPVNVARWKKNVFNPKRKYRIVFIEALSYNIDIIHGLGKRQIGNTVLLENVSSSMAIPVDPSSPFL